MQLVIVDDHRLFLDAIHVALSERSPESEIHVFADAMEALRFLESHEEVDLILADLNMPAMDGYAFLGALAERNLLVPVMVISASQSLFQVQRALAAGAVGYVPKTTPIDQTLAAIDIVIETGEYLPPGLRESLKRAHRDRALPETKLSPRQLEVLVLLAKGHSNDEIAARLSVSLATVKTHVQAIMGELAVNNRTQCAMRAVAMGLLQVDEID